MASRTDFGEQEWDSIVHGPPGAGLVVMIAESGGQLRETTAIARAYASARKDDEITGLLAEIITEQPEIDSPRSGTPEELEQLNLDRLRDAIDALRDKATIEEIDDYRAFTIALAKSVAHAQRTGFLGLGGPEVSEAEAAAVERIRAALA